MNDPQIRAALERHWAASAAGILATGGDRLLLGRAIWRRAGSDATAGVAAGNRHAYDPVDFGDAQGSGSVR